MHLTLTPQILPDADSFNVIADWPGTDKADEIVIVSGHLDSWDLATGANDDASGVVSAMAVIDTLQEARLPSAPHDPRDRLDERRKRHARRQHVSGSEQSETARRARDRLHLVSGQHGRAAGPLDGAAGALIQIALTGIFR
jgi:hypothetical protein